MRKLPRDISRQSGQPLGVAGQSTLHESAWLHVTGTARYIDDLPEPEGILHAAVGHSEQAHARVLSLDLSAVRAYPGVVAVLTVDDVPGHTDIGPVFPGDPVLAGELVEHIGQPLFAVAATSHTAARKAAKLAKVEYEPLHAVLDTREAWRSSFLSVPATPSSAVTRTRHWPARRIASRAKSMSAGRSTSTWKVRPVWRCRRKTAACLCIPPASTPPRCRSWWPRCWGCRFTR